MSVEYMSLIAERDVRIVELKTENAELRKTLVVAKGALEKSRAHCEGLSVIECATCPTKEGCDLVMAISAITKQEDE